MDCTVQQEICTQWLTSRINGRACATWALPGCSYARAAVKDGRSIVDEAHACLTDDTLYWLFPEPERWKALGLRRLVQW
ncbi:hypothetical protein BKA82DRAFT_995661 [Pisolithus tinctorius]|uniref:Uncharacterized protein n=1 Tax=Pisolithus tinctorius Marx 270 TaxID=870435 RepID=A0A0C3JMR1_PISTI|nr:hypothetical protein BKA82DRAFT_995661 [Pisolithus tinctorius]KIO10468.1 hypothetical protein M404DRAFT_995661 [Pisolithus tinctorius Marx 270]